MAVTVGRNAALVAALAGRLDPGDPVAQSNLAWFAGRSGDLEQARAAARLAASLPHAPPAAWHNLEQLALGRRDDLILAGGRSGNTDRMVGGATPLAAAVAAHRQGAQAVAEACYHAAIPHAALASCAWNGLAVLHQQRGESEAAEHAWQEVAESDPVALHNRALAGIRSDRLERARELINRQLPATVNSAPVSFMAGYAALLAGDLYPAHQHLSRALTIDDGMARAQFTLGLVEERIGNHHQALLATRRALLMSPWYMPQVWLLQDDAGAVPVEIPAGPGHGGGDAPTDDVLLGLGRSLLETGNFGESLAVFDQVLLRHPSHTAALFHRGVVLAKLRRYGEALEDWEEVSRTDPEGELGATSLRHAQSARQLAALFGVT